ncbi:MAG: amidohydrolase [Clostridia bacterium]|nr:amidohydrolase [Clostridia bacterium]MBQ3092492.1 amidohydrolase [Clostridia bacterium]
MRIMGGRLITADGQEFENGYVDFKDGVITAFGDAATAAPAEDEVYDAAGGYIMPGFIDAHTHIGIMEQSVRWEGNDVNEAIDPITPQLKAVDAIYPYDSAFADAVECGVTSAVVGPGSANIIGGEMAFIKLSGDDIEDMIVKAPCAMKMALGENPKSCYGLKQKTPQTRMATAAILREALTKARNYMEKKEKGGEPAYDAKCEALIPVLKGELVAHIHCHRCDDILTAIRIAKEFGIRYTIIHATDGIRAARQLKEAGVIPVIGPVLSGSSKPETANRSLKTAGVLYKEGIEVALTTDHGVVPLMHLPISAAVSVREGLDMDAAIRSITINAAKAAEVEDRVGSIAVGKDADIVVWSGHPFEFLSKPKAVYISGKRVR